MTARGAYGLRLLNLPDDETVHGALVQAPVHWPAVSVRLEQGPPNGSAGSPSPTDSDHVSLGLPDGGSAAFDRRAATATLRTPLPLTRGSLVHPALAYVGSVFSTWLGRSALHAGAFLNDGGAWAILGEHESGKSSTLAWLARAGHPILADDMVVLDGLTAFAGPRSIDLRPATAEMLNVNGSADAVREGLRHRLTPRQTAAEHALRGWFVLSWGDRLEARRIPPGERLAALVQHLHPIQARGGPGLLDLLTLPAFEVSRPQDLKALPEAAATIVRIADGNTSD